jgi:FKBP-type peptidyl-prolyl cis-trans isomerase FkpA
MKLETKTLIQKKGTLIIAVGLLIAGASLYFSKGGSSLLSSQPDDVVIETLTQGSGAVAERGQMAVVKYTTYVKAGMKKVDSSLDRNSDFVFRLGAGQVVAGWDKGTQGMRVGEKRRITVPSKYAYGEKGAGDTVPPNAVLVYDTELVRLEEYKAPVFNKAQPEAVKQSPKTVETPAAKKN